MFWALLRLIFSPRLAARAKMSLSRAQNVFMPANINSIVILHEAEQSVVICLCSANKLFAKAEG